MVILGTKQLSEAMKVLMHIVPKKPVVEALGGVRIRADVDLFLEAMSLDTKLEVEIEGADVVNPFGAIVPARLLAEVADSLPDVPNTELSVKDNQVIVKAGRAKFKLPILADSESLPEFELADSWLEIPVSDLDKKLKKVIYAAATDELMKNLNGVFFELTGDEFRLVASDGFRLAVVKSECSTGDEKLGVILPLRAAKALAKMAKDETRVLVSPAYVSVQNGPYHMVSRVIDAEFPKYRRVIPEEFITRLKAEADELVAVIKRASVIDSNAIKLQIASDGLTVQAENDSKHMSETFECEVYGEELEIGFNPKYLLEALSRFSGAVELGFTENSGPVRIISPDDPDYLAIIMPLRL